MGRTATSKPLNWAQRRDLTIIALPTFGLALASTIVTTYTPVMLNELSGPMVTGLLIGCEGLFGILLPLAIGSWSDSLRTRFGGRVPFVLAAAPCMVLALALMPFMEALAPLVLLLAVFFAAYFAYYTPYRAVYPDVVPGEVAGRSQGVQKTLREAGLGLALVSGGFLLALWRPAPFLLAAAIVGASTVGFAVWIVRSRRTEPPSNGQTSVRERVDSLRDLLHEHPVVRWVVVGNALWEGTIAALKTFVVLFLTVGLGRSAEMASGVLGVVALLAVIGALAGGALSDRLGAVRLMRLAVWVYAVGALVPVFVHSLIAMIAVVPVAVAAAVVMTLPYALLIEAAPEADHGLTAGLFDTSRGFGSLVGPIMAGVAITTLEPVFHGTDGYAAMFLVVSVFCFASLIPLSRLRRLAP